LQSLIELKQPNDHVPEKGIVLLEILAGTEMENRQDLLPRNPANRENSDQAVRRQPHSFS
jgi:hypothetical protein